MPARVYVAPRRDNVVQVRVTPRERTRWREAALADEMGLSEYIRAAVRAHIERRPRNRRTDDAEGECQN